VRLGEQLVAEGAVAPALVDAALARMAETGERIGSALIGVGASADRVAMALAGQKRVLAARDGHLAAVTVAVRERVPEAVARRLIAVPVRIAPGTGELVVALRDPDDQAALAELARVSGLVVKPAVAAEVRLARALRVVYGGEPWEPRTTPAPPRTRRPAPTTEGLMQLATSAPPAGMDPASIGLRGRLVLAAGLVALVVGVWWTAWDRAQSAATVPALADEYLPGLAVDLPAADWRGPSAVAVAPGSLLITRAAIYQRRGHRGDGRRRDMLVLSRLRAPVGGAMLTLDWLASHARATVFTLRGMTVDAATCRPAGLRSERDLRCEGSGHWGGRDIGFDQVSWKAASGDLLQATWITYGPRAAIAGDLERAARSVTDLE
jgi:hypothetical protein